MNSVKELIGIVVMFAAVVGITVVNALAWA